MTQEELDYALIDAAADRDDTDRVKELIAMGANVNTVNNRDWFQEGYTPLMRASMYGNTEAVKLLLESGANIKLTNRHGISSFMMACSNGYIEIAELLLKHGADIDKFGNGWNPITAAAMHDCQKIITFLLENGADINRANHRGETALMMVCRNAVGKKKAIKLLLAAGADVNAADKEGQTALMGLASEGGYTELMHILIKFGADPDIRNNKGQTALDLLGGHYPKKYAKWQREVRIRQREVRIKNLKLEDSIRNSADIPDWNI